MRYGEMISNLVLTGTYNIGITNEKMMLNGNKNDIKDIPFIRYRFEDYADDKLDYIKSMQSKFKYSAHLAEVYVKEGFIEEVKNLKEKLNNIIVFLYIPITNEDVTADGISENTENLLYDLVDANLDVDRVMLKDLSSSLFTVVANKMKKRITEILGCQISDVGICCSPLSVFDGNACLTAMKARELSAIYNDNPVAVPSEKHECKNDHGCCCIRHFIVNSDIAAPVIKVGNTGGSEKKSDEDGDSAENEKKKTAKKVTMMLTSW